jgi:translation initiation factor IF-2
MVSKKKDASGENDGAGKDAGESLDDKKKAALNLFEESERKEEQRGKGKRNQIESKASEGTVFSSLTGPQTDSLLRKRHKASEELEDSGVGRALDPEETEGAVDGEEIDPSRVINLKPPIVVKNLAAELGLKPFILIKDLMDLDVFVNQNQSVESDVADKICRKHGFVLEQEKREKGKGIHKVEKIIEEPEEEEAVEGDELVARPPIVTFMGHVDHGKTSLLDYYRGSKVADGEAGGITQHVGAYSVTRGEKKVTFIDTPGHEAFTEMRARGANVTDIVVLVIAADDGIMPTTVEAIDHARAAEVGIIVAINKIDLPRADVMKVKTQLQERDLAPEDWGGSTLCVEVSAKTGEGLDKLFEAITLQAEIMELSANPEGPARGTVIEAEMNPGKGATAIVVVQSGTLKAGVPFICGNYSGKVKLLMDTDGGSLDSVGPAEPAEILGFSGLPDVGDELIQMDSERNAKKLSEERLVELRQKKLAKPVQTSLETLFQNIEAGTKKSLRLILKCDVQGSVEAVVNSLREIESDKITLEILHASAGPITESDVLLASASEAVIIGFNTKLEGKAVSIAKREGIQVKLFSIIYELIDQVKDAMEGMLDPEMRENVIGHAEVRELFKLSSGRVGGCIVIDGRISRSARARVVRDGQAVYDGGFATLRRFKEDVKEVRNGLECGIRLGQFNDYVPGDIIECYELEKIAQTL